MAYSSSETKVVKEKRGLFNHKIKKDSKQFEKSEKVISSDSDNLALNVRKIKTLIEMGKDDQAKEKLTAVYELIKYSNPSRSKEVEKLDQKIADLLDDVKIMIVKEKKDEKLYEQIEEVRIAVIDRNNAAESGI